MVGESFELEEWDDDVLVQLDQAAELALSVQSSHCPPPASYLPPPPSSQRHPLIAPPCHVSYSPPREMSQRTHETCPTGVVPDFVGPIGTSDTHFAKEQENVRLKRELHDVSKHLHQLEEEILELRKERDKKEEQLQVLHSKIEAKDTEFQNTKNAEIPTAPGIPTLYQNANPSNNQFDSSKICSSEKLFRLWNSDGQNQGKALVAKVFTTCESDLHVLYGYVNSPKKGSIKAIHSKEFEKVSQLYSVLTKLQVSYDSLILRDLLGTLADLCSLKNVVILRSSIRILHVVLSNSFCMDKEFGKRENVTVKEHVSEDINSDINGSEDQENESLCFAKVGEILKQGQILSGLESSNVKPHGRTGFIHHSFGTSITTVFWVSLFERMCLVSIENNEKQIRCEAHSVMNLILMRHNVYSERNKFAGELVFRCLSQSLRREAGVSVQDRAVHTLYLLCNCPRVILMLCTGPTGIEEDVERACSKDINDKSTTAIHWLDEILIGLAECVACYGSFSVEEMKLRKNTITLLAFLGSVGRFGFEILLNHKLANGTNFLAVILQSLTSDLDPHALRSAKESGIVKEQCLLIREALIFLNRLVSHPDYSVPVLQALTNTGEMASTTVDFANRLTHSSNMLWSDIGSKAHIRESEIMELARVFKKRVFTFLGDGIS